MEYRKAKNLERGDVVEPCRKDINGKEVLPHGNYLVERVDIDDINKVVIVTLDNGQQINHKNLSHAWTCGGSFYCSWCGMVDGSINNAGLSYRQILRCGIIPKDLIDDFNNLSEEDFNKKYPH